MKITVKVILNVPVKKAWEFFTKPAHITGWNYASDDWQCPWAENDLRIGGKLKSRMESRDGSMGFDFEGIYDEIDEFRILKYTLGDGRKVEVTFGDNGKNTVVTETFDAEDTNPAEMQKTGWQNILDNYKKYSEKSA
jgi:uncharacterized protein YndB with AHSA1/START domain